MVGVAVNITFVSAQIVMPGFALMLTDGATVDVTTIVIPADVAVVGLAHANDEVISTVTISPFTRVEF